MSKNSAISGEIKDFLDQKVEKYNHTSFIENDPISIPHRYHTKEDIEISSFLTATISWGKRTTILKNASKMMQLMGESPYDFVMTFDAKRNKNYFDGFVHRTFNAEDLVFFVKSLNHIYTNLGGMEKVFEEGCTSYTVLEAISNFKEVFFSIDHPERTKKHVGDPRKGSVAKRLNMMLRWLCRKDDIGVDFGLWKDISPSILSCPLDVHSGNIARKLGLITRKNNDLKALFELDANLRKMDPSDPAKYDFALFGVGESGELS